MTDRIIFDDVSKSYPSAASKWAVKDFSLEVKKEEFFCLVGPSGCGKSTVLKLIVGLEKPTSGKIERAEAISMVFQSGALLPWLTVAANVAFGLEMIRKDEHEIHDLCNKYLQMVNLLHFSSKYPRELSGGQRQRVGIARALAVEPKVLLLDEPFSALDPITTEELHKDLLAIWKETKITIIMVSHLLEEAVLLADRVGIMANGSLKGIIEINLKRPRKDTDADFIQRVKKLKNLLS